MLLWLKSLRFGGLDVVQVFLLPVPVSVRFLRSFSLRREKKFNLTVPHKSTLEGRGRTQGKNLRRKGRDSQIN